MDANALLVGKKTKEAQKSKAVPAKEKGSTGKRNICSVYLYSCVVGLGSPILRRLLFRRRYCSGMLGQGNASRYGRHHPVIFRAPKLTLFEA